MIFFYISKKKHNKITKPAHFIKVNNIYISWWTNRTSKLIIVKDSRNLNFYFKDEHLAEIDLKKQVIFFSRGKSSRMPLFYFQNDEEIIVFSHFRAIQKIGLKLIENKESVDELILYGYIFPPNTIYKGAKRVLFDELVIIKLSETLRIKIKKEKIFSVVSKKKIDISNIKECLYKSIFSNLNNTNKAKVSLLFSGGIDSSIILKIFLDQKKPINCLSTGFKYEEIDKVEKNNAVDAAKKLKAKHVHHDFSNEEFLKALIYSIYYTEEPVMHMQSVLLFLLFSKYRPLFSKIIYNGQGADGVFGQYLQYKLFHSRKIFNVERILNTSKNFTWLKKKLNFSKNRTTKNRRFFLKKINNYKKQDKLFFFDLLGDVDITQTCWNKCAQSQGLEVYYPYLNKDLIRLISSIPWKYKLLEPKNILKKIAQEIKIPETIINRKKGNFGPVSTNWGKYFSPFFPLCSLYYPESILKELQDNPDKRYILWNIINISLWRKLFIEKENPNALIIKYIHN